MLETFPPQAIPALILAVLVYGVGFPIALGAIACAAFRTRKPRRRMVRRRYL